MGQQVLSGFHQQDSYSRDLVSHFDVAERATVQTSVHCAATSNRVERAVFARLGRLRKPRLFEI